MPPLLSFDVETGGLHTDYSLLTASFVLFDGKHKLDELNLKLKPPKGGYVLTERALEVNKIDLKELEEFGCHLEDAKYLLAGKLVDWTVTGEKIIPCGHGIQFDIKFLLKYIVDENIWLSHTNHEIVDTKVLARLLVDAGCPVGGTSLEKLTAFLGVKYQTKAHDALSDAIAAYDCYQIIKKVALMSNLSELFSAVGK